MNAPRKKKRPACPVCRKRIGATSCAQTGTPVAANYIHRAPVPADPPKPPRLVI